VKEVKNWGESVSDLMFVKTRKKQLQETVHSTVWLGRFTFCTCCIVICFGCFIPSFKLFFG